MSKTREIPLSFAQRQLWFLEQLAPGKAGYNLLDAFRVRGPFRADVWQRCLGQLSLRHESLRASVKEVDGQPVQIIAESVEVPLFQYDVRGLADHEREREAKRIAAEEIQRTVPLGQAPLWRVSLIQLGEEDYWVLLTIHHIIFDGWSAGVFWEELVALYEADVNNKPCSLAERPLQIEDFVRWEQQHLQGEVLDNLLGYWKGKLSGTLPRLALPADFPRPLQPIHRGAKASITLPASLVEQLRELTRKQQTTLFITLLTAYKVFLHRYTNEEDILVGTPFACRTQLGHDGILGFLVNTLVLRSRLDSSQSFLDCMTDVRATSVEAYDHGGLPFGLLVEAVRPERELSYNPLFQTMFQMNGQNEIKVNEAGLTLEPLALETYAANFDLTLEVLESATGLVLRMEYATDLFRPETIMRLLRNYQVLLEEVVAAPGRRIGDFAVMTSAEREQLLEVWNHIASPCAGSSAIDLNVSIKGQDGELTGDLVVHGDGVPTCDVASMLEQFLGQLRRSAAGQAGVESRRRLVWRDDERGYRATAPVRCLHRYFEDQADQNPDRIAARHNGRRMTYGELNAAANQLAHELIHRGVLPDTPVGLCLERSLDLVVALLAVLKSGGAYLPLDPGYPVERLKFMLEDAQVRIVVTSSVLCERLAIAASSALCLDREQAELHGRSRENPDVLIDPARLAYIIYTSGSTGKPKGVMIEHRAASHFVQAAIEHYGITGSDCVLQFGSISFDLAVEEIFTCLSAGGRLQLRDEEMLGTPARFTQCCQEWGVTILDLPTAYWHQLVSEMAQSGVRLPDSVRLVIIGGERVLPSVVENWLRIVGDYPRLFNSYGPTETTVVATGHWIGGDFTPRHEIPIGRPLPNTEVYVLDSRRKPVPIGAPGELYIGGRSVARGYLNRPELTSECFIANPVRPESNGRLYKSGDRVRFLHDGSLEFLGRVDNQVKIRGFRIELGEIESAVLRFPGVREVVVVANADDSGSHRLNAYVVPQSNQTISEQRLRDFLKQNLPVYMVPAAIVSLSSLPLTPNGKIDVRALPHPALVSSPEERRDSALTGPRNPLEERLALIWSEVLNVPKVGIRDRFFDLGGHSLQAVQIITRIRKEFDVELPLSALFQSPSIEEMAALLAEAGAEILWSPLVPFQAGGTKRPFFAIHGGHGEVLFYKSLAEHLGPEQPFYALRARGNDYPQMPHQSVEEMAADYIAAMRTIQPEGPYRIGGASFGGIVAFEMAQQLHAAGEVTEALVLFDTGGFRDFTRPLPWPQRLFNILRYIPRYGLAETWHRLQVRLLRFFVSDSEVEFYRATGELPKESSGVITAWEAVWKANLEASDRYQPKVFPGAIQLIRATDDGNYMWFECHPDYGWDGYAQDGVKGYDVTGTHIGMFQEPHVKDLARTLEQLLSGEVAN